ncbi:hypothetical protein [Streptomyces chartreusis]
MSQQSPGPQQIPVVVLAGFLGSGKTTLHLCAKGLCYVLRGLEAGFYITPGQPNNQLWYAC